MTGAPHGGGTHVGGMRCGPQRDFRLVVPRLSRQAMRAAHNRPLAPKQHFPIPKQLALPINQGHLFAFVVAETV